MALKLVVFDLDGTLVTAEIDFMAMRQVIQELLLAEGFPPEVLPMNSTQDLLRSAFAYAGKKGFSPVDISRLRDKVYEVAETIEWEGARKAQLVPGAREILHELKNHGIHVAILTNDNQHVAEYLLSKYDLDQYVDLLISRDEVAYMKPSTVGLELILNRFEATPAEALFIGDSTIDVMTAKKLGIPCICRLSKLRTEKELQEEGALAVFPTLIEVIAFLKKKKFLPKL